MAVYMKSRTVMMYYWYHSIACMDRTSDLNTRLVVGVQRCVIHLAHHLRLVTLFYIDFSRRWVV